MLHLNKFPDMPISTREEARESRHIQRSPVSASWLESRDPFPAWSAKNSRRSVASQEEALSTGKARGTPGSCTIPRVPQMSQSIPGNPVFPALPRLSHRGSTHTTVARGTALWERLMGKPLGKPRGKAPDPLIHAKGSVTLRLQLGRKTHVHAPTRDED